MTYRSLCYFVKLTPIPLLILASGCLKNVSFQHGTTKVALIDTLYAVDYNKVRLRIRAVDGNTLPIDFYDVKWSAGANLGEISHIRIPARPVVDTIIQVGFGPKISFYVTPEIEFQKYAPVITTVDLRTPPILAFEAIQSERLAKVIKIDEHGFALLTYGGDSSNRYGVIRYLNADFDATAGRYLQDYNLQQQDMVYFGTSIAPAVAIVQSVYDERQQQYALLMHKYDIHDGILWSTEIARGSDPYEILAIKPTRNLICNVLFRRKGTVQLYESVVDGNGLLLTSYGSTLPLDISAKIAAPQIMMLGSNDYIVSIANENTTPQSYWGISRFTNGQQRWRISDWYIPIETPISIVQLQTETPGKIAVQSIYTEEETGVTLTRYIDMNGTLIDSKPFYNDNYRTSAVVCPAVAQLDDSTLMFGGHISVGANEMPYLAKVNAKNGWTIWSTTLKTKQELVKGKIVGLLPTKDGAYFAFCEAINEPNQQNTLLMYRLKID